MNDESGSSALLDWLDRREDWQFVGVLYIARWLVLVPVLVLSHFVLPPAQAPKPWSEGTPFGLFLGLVLVPPLLETALECTLPYWIMSRLRGSDRPPPRRWWSFVVVSACVMAALHPMLGALLPAFVTGTFLAYCYAHFATTGVWTAFLATAGFHAAINVVGWAMFVFF